MASGYWCSLLLLSNIPWDHNQQDKDRAPRATTPMELSFSNTASIVLLERMKMVAHAFASMGKAA
jgi:hypothetical protein